MMSVNPDTQRNSKILYLFSGFVLLFVISFSLGVIVGKGLSDFQEVVVVDEYISEDISDVPDNTTEYKGSKAEQGFDVDKRKNDSSIVAGKKDIKESETNQPDESKGRADIVREDEEVLPTPGGTDSSVKSEESDMSRNLNLKMKLSHSSREEYVVKSGVNIQPKKEQDKISLPPVESGGMYTVQIASFKEKMKAGELVSSLKSRGYPAFIKESEIPKQGKYYRVRIGTFNTRDKAGMYGKNLKYLEPQINTVLVTLNN